MIKSFHCVYTFEGDNFRLQGIFTKESDAAEGAKEINPDFIKNGDGEVYVVNNMTLAVIIDSILSDRLQQLYEPLKKLAGIDHKEPYGCKSPDIRQPA